jgi:hypothetical protein
MLHVATRKSTDDESGFLCLNNIRHGRAPSHLFDPSIHICACSLVTRHDSPSDRPSERIINVRAPPRTELC